MKVERNGKEFETCVARRTFKKSRLYTACSF